jgi:hypothetical protein
MEYELHISPIMEVQSFDLRKVGWMSEHQLVMMGFSSGGGGSKDLA